MIYGPIFTSLNWYFWYLDTGNNWNVFWSWNDCWSFNWWISIWGNLTIFVYIFIFSTLYYSLRFFILYILSLIQVGGFSLPFFVAGIFCLLGSAATYFLLPTQSKFSNVKNFTITYIHIHTYTYISLCNLNTISISWISLNFTQYREKSIKDSWIGTSFRIWIVCKFWCLRQYSDYIHDFHECWIQWRYTWTSYTRCEWISFIYVNVSSIRI